MPNTSVDLYTTIRNTSGARIHMGWLPPYGGYVNADTDVTIFGDIFDHLRKGGHPCKRAQAAVESMLINNLIDIVKTPAVFMLDSTTNAVKKLALSNRTLGIADPSWGGFTEV